MDGRRESESVTLRSALRGHKANVLSMSASFVVIFFHPPSSSSQLSSYLVLIPLIMVHDVISS